MRRMAKLKRDNEHKVGVISDTHGLVRPEALDALQGVELIIHAGDVGAREVLARLREIAPVVAVRGNVDREGWARTLPLAEAVEVSGVPIYILHDLSQIALDPATAGFRVVISGHTHQAAAAEQNHVLYLNPGSAGPRRFTLPVSLARLVVRGDEVSAKIVNL